MGLLPVIVEPPVAEKVLAYIYRLRQKKVPKRVAIKRAEKRFGMPAHIIREVLREAEFTWG